MSIDLDKLVKQAIEKRMSGFNWPHVVQLLTTKMTTVDREKFFETLFEKFKEKCEEELKKQGSLLR
jgi:hypothetical protein